MILFFLKVSFIFSIIWAVMLVLGCGYFTLKPSDKKKLPIFMILILIGFVLFLFLGIALEYSVQGIYYMWLIFSLVGLPFFSAVMVEVISSLCENKKFVKEGVGKIKTALVNIMVLRMVFLSISFLVGYVFVTFFIFDQLFLMYR